MDTQVYVFYIDIRATGKGYEEFIQRAQREFDVKYVRGRVSKLYEEDGKVMVRGMDTLMGDQVEIAADLVVLATGITCADGAVELAQKLNTSYDQWGFFKESHPKLRPVETNTAGVFLAGACQSPKDIPTAVAQASGTASKVLGLLAKDKLKTSPQIAEVDQSRCVSCWKCIEVCPLAPPRSRSNATAPTRATSSRQCARAAAYAWPPAR
jgi:heterodisulfide reductase subunit A